MLYEGVSSELQSQPEITDSQVNVFLGKMDMWKNGSLSDDNSVEEEDSMESTVYNTLMLEYDIFLFEEQVKYYKVILADKELEIKKLKEMQHKKQAKVISVKQSMKKLNKKIRDVSDGFKIMNQKKHDSSRSEESHRTQRLTYQQKKNRQLQDKQGNMLAQIDQYESYQSEYSNMKAENEELREQIQKIQNRKKSVESGNPHSPKQQLKLEIKKLYERIKMAEKDQEKICKQYESQKKRQRHMEHEQNAIGQKHIEMNNCYNRINDIKQECKERRWAKAERQRQYHQLITEENHLKKQLAQLEHQQHQPHHQPQSAQKRPQSKSSYVHNFKIIDSEADEELGRGQKEYRSSSKKHFSSDSQQQMQELIDRFQKLKSKSKNLT